MVEPQKEMLEKCKQNYQNIKNLNYVIAAVYKRHEMVNLLVAENPTDYSHTGWAFILPDRFEGTIYKDRTKRFSVQGMPLMEIIRMHNFERVDLLQVDTEGYDAKVIRQFDFKNFRPVMIQFEYVHL